MSSANMIPSAPPGDENFYSTPTQLYPNIPATSNAENFWLTEISKIEKQIAGEVEHYRLVLKKYKKQLYFLELLQPQLLELGSWLACL